MNEKGPLTRKEQLQIEGYKALLHYGCQMSADHISTDRVMIPLSLAPALWVLRPLNGQFDDNWAKTFILLGGYWLIGFWMLRNQRSEKRLYAIWDILPLIEKDLGFKAFQTLKLFMDTREFRDGRFRRLPSRDFTLKKWFGRLALAFYGVVFIYIWWWANIVSFLRWLIKC